MSMPKVTTWTAPEGGGAPLLTMPNVPHPLHGLAPRTIMGSAAWKAYREQVYAEHDDVCEICGQKLCGKLKGDYPLHHAHEVYDIDYEAKTCTFIRACCICPACHTGFIHSGRAITMYKNHMPLWSKEVLLDGAEHGFELVHKWNKLHPDSQLKVFQTIEEWLKEPSLKEELQALIDQYEIQFYHVPDTDTKKDWGKWKLIYDDTEYYSPYQSKEEWKAMMDKNNHREAENNKQLFSGDEFEELRNNLINKEN